MAIQSGFRSLDLKWAFNPDDCNNWILKTFFGKRFFVPFPEQTAAPYDFYINRVRVYCSFWIYVRRPNGCGWYGAYSPRRIYRTIYIAPCKYDGGRRTRVFLEGLFQDIQVRAFVRIVVRAQ